MSDKVIIIKLGPERGKVPADKTTKNLGRDVWRFKEIRETLWGPRTSVRCSKDVWDFAGIRKRLWGR